MTTIFGLPTIQLLRDVARTTSSVDQWLFGCRVLDFSEPLGIAAASRYRGQAWNQLLELQMKVSAVLPRQV